MSVMSFILLYVGLLLWKRPQNVMHSKYIPFGSECAM
jgi:hypothetical protein